MRAVRPQLRDHIALVQRHYNFLRPHYALRFERETRTLAMQGGLVAACLTWREIFAAGCPASVLVILVGDVGVVVSARQKAA